MNKNIIKALSNYSFEYNKNWGYGNIEGYEANISNNNFQLGPVLYISSFLSQTKKNDFLVKFNSLNISMCQAATYDFGVAVMIGAATSGTFIKKFQQVMPKILEILTEIEAPKSNICPQSGEELTEDNSTTISWSTNGIKVRISNNAVEVVNSVQQKAEADYKNAPNNYLKGFLGILIGSLVGAGVAIGFEILGLITWIAPLISILLGTFLYRLFHGKQTYMMIVMSFFTTLITILLALFIAYLIVCTNVCHEADIDIAGIEALKFVMNEVPEVKSGFILDFVINTIVVLAVEVFSITMLISRIKRSKPMK